MGGRANECGGLWNKAISLRNVRVLFDYSPCRGYAENHVRSILERDGYKVAQPRSPGYNKTEAGHPDFIVFGEGGGRLYVEAKAMTDHISASQLKWIINHPDESVVIYCMGGVERPEPEIGELARCSRRVLSDVELQAMRKSCVEERDRAIVEFLRSTGCMAFEMLYVSIGDVDVRNQKVLLKRTRSKAGWKWNSRKRVYMKGKYTPRVVFLDEIATEVVVRYIERRRADGARDTDPLFTIDQGGKKGSTKDARMVRYIIKRIAKDAGIADWQNISSKVFRRGAGG
jgi:integrase